MKSNSVCKNSSLLLDVSFVIAWAKPDPDVGGFFFLKEVKIPLMDFKWKSMEPHHHSNRMESPLRPNCPSLLGFGAQWFCWTQGLDLTEEFVLLCGFVPVMTEKLPLTTQSWAAF